MVAGQQHPCQIGLVRHHAQSLAQGFGRGRLGVEAVTRQQDMGGTTPPRGRGKPVQGAVPRLPQAVADRFGITAEGLAQMQVGRVQEAEGHGPHPVRKSGAWAPRSMVLAPVANRLHRSGDLIGRTKGRTSHGRSHHE